MNLTFGKQNPKRATGKVANTVTLTLKTKNKKYRQERECVPNLEEGIPKHFKFNGDEGVHGERFKNVTDPEAPIQHKKKEAFLEQKCNAARGADWEYQIHSSEVEDEGVRCGAIGTIPNHS